MAAGDEEKPGSSWDRRFSPGTLVAIAQLLVVILGGLYALSEMKSQIGGLQGAFVVLQHQVETIGNDLTLKSTSLGSRIDQLYDRLGKN